MFQAVLNIQHDLERRSHLHVQAVSVVLQALRVGGSMEQVHIKLLHIRVSVARCDGRDGSADASGRTVGGVCSRNRLSARRVQRGEKGTGAIGQGAVGRDAGGAVAAAEVDAAAVGSRYVVERIQ